MVSSPYITVVHNTRRDLNYTFVYQLFIYRKIHNSWRTHISQIQKYNFICKANETKNYYCVQQYNVIILAHVSQTQCIIFSKIFIYHLLLPDIIYIFGGIYTFNNGFRFVRRMCIELTLTFTMWYIKCETEKIFGTHRNNRYISTKHNCFIQNGRPNGPWSLCFLVKWQRFPLCFLISQWKTPSNVYNTNYTVRQ